MPSFQIGRATFDLANANKVEFPPSITSNESFIFVRTFVQNHTNLIPRLISSSIKIYEIFLRLKLLQRFYPCCCNLALSRVSRNRLNRVSQSSRKNQKLVEGNEQGESPSERWRERVGEDRPWAKSSTKPIASPSASSRTFLGSKDGRSKGETRKRSGASRSWNADSFHHLSVSLLSSCSSEEFIDRWNSCTRWLCCS